MADDPPDDHDWESLPAPGGPPAAEPQYKESDKPTADVWSGLDHKKVSARQQIRVWVSFKLFPKPPSKTVYETCAYCSGHVHRPHDDGNVIDADGKTLAFGSEFNRRTGREITSHWHVPHLPGIGFEHSFKGVHFGKWYSSLIQSKTEIRCTITEYLHQNMWVQDSANYPPKWEERIQNYEFGPSVVWERQQIKACSEFKPEGDGFKFSDDPAKAAFAVLMEQAGGETLAGDAEAVASRPCPQQKT